MFKNCEHKIPVQGTSLGLDFLRSCFKPNNKPFKDARNILMTNINKSNYAKNKIYELADPAIKFNTIE